MKRKKTADKRRTLQNYRNPIVYRRPLIYLWFNRPKRIVYNEQIIDSRTNKITTITNEILRSAQEVQIANYLYLHKIDYTYESPYPYHILKAKKPYTPDFCIKQGNKIAYIEHFGITESGHHSYYTPEQLAKYKKEIIDKIALHKKHGTTLVYTFSKYNDGRELSDHLQEELTKNGFVLEKRPSEEVFEKLVNTEENKYIARLVKLICVFINNFKTNGYNIDDFYRFERGNTNVRTKLFLDICKECYLEYQKKLAESNSIDFQDMINDSARILHEKEIAKETLDFKYIIVDEYQDISRQRFDLTKELSNLCSAKIIAVGDDKRISKQTYKLRYNTTQIVSQNNFNDIINIIEQSKNRALKAVNAEKRSRRR